METTIPESAKNLIENGNPPWDIKRVLRRKT
ncbi:MAG: hypothetical protein ACD_71C00007G0009, partial [uncultured bacterium (gcode 4)]